MIRGRGATSCLICNDDRKVCIFNNISIIYGIRLLFDTHKYNIMLMDSKICIKCAGRLHQLFDFNLIKTNFEIQRQVAAEQTKESTEEIHCEFCDGESDLMHGGLVGEVKNAASLTKWSKNYGLEEHVYCCYSCYNYLLLYAEIKRIMDQECINFYLNIRNWKVLMPKKLTEEEVAKALNQPCGSEQEENFVSKGCEVEKEHNTELIVTIPESSESAECSQKKTVGPKAIPVYSDGNNEMKEFTQKNSNAAEAIQTKRQGCDDNQMDTDDIFTSIKPIRSTSQPIDDKLKDTEEKSISIKPIENEHNDTEEWSTSVKIRRSVSRPIGDNTNFIKTRQSASRSADDKQKDTDDETVSIKTLRSTPGPIANKLMDTEDNFNSIETRSSQPIKKKPNSDKTDTTVETSPGLPPPQTVESPTEISRKRVSTKCDENGQKQPLQNKSKTADAVPKKRQKMQYDNGIQIGELSTIKKRRSSFGAFKPQKVPDYNHIQFDFEDKFSSIKKRHSSSARAILLTPSNMKKKKFPKLFVQDKQDNDETFAISEDFFNKPSELPSVVALGELVVEEETLPVNSDSLSFQEVPLLSDSASESTLSIPDLFFINAPYAEVSNNVQDVTTVKDIEELVSTPEIYSQEETYSASSSLTIISGIDDLELLVPDIETSLFPQLSNVGSEVEIETQTDAFTDEKLFEMYNLRTCSVSCDRINPDELQKYLEKEMLAFTLKVPKITKSGRVWKPKIIIDPSTTVTHRNSIKLKKKLEPKIQQKKFNEHKEKIRKSKCAKKDTLDHSDYLKIQSPHENVQSSKHIDTGPAFKKVKSKQAKPAIKYSATLKLQYPDEEEIPELEEDFVDYSNSNVSTQVINDDDDESRIVNVEQPPQEHTEMEFLSPYYKHRGKVVINGSVLKLVRLDPRTVRSAC